MFLAGLTAGVDNSLNYSVRYSGCSSLHLFCSVDNFKEGRYILVLRGVGLLFFWGVVI